MKDVYKRIKKLKKQCDKLTEEIKEKTEEIAMFADSFYKNANEIVFRYKSALELAEKLLKANREQFNDFQEIKAAIMNYNLPVIEKLNENFFYIRETQSSHILVPYVALLDISKNKYQKILMFFPNDTYNEYFNLPFEEYRLSSRATLCLDDRFFYIHSGNTFQMSNMYKLDKKTMKKLKFLKCPRPLDAKIFIYNYLLILVELFGNSSTSIEFYDRDDFRMIESNYISIADLKGAILNQSSLFLAKDYIVYEFDIKTMDIVAEFECCSKIYMIYFHELLHIVCENTNETRSKKYVIMYCEDLHLDSPFPEYMILNQHLCWGRNKTYYLFNMASGGLLKIEI